MIHFATSGIDTWLWLPPLAALVIAFFSSMVGISGAFLLLPFQMSVLGFNSPAVSATNLVFNLVATPSGAWRYLREGRMLWPLAWVVVAGSLPGIAAGYWIRIAWLPDPAHFKLFAACVLGYIGVRLARDWISGGGTAGALPANATLNPLRSDWRRVEFALCGATYGFSVAGMFLLAVVVGVIGGAYGIGGGSIIAPFCVAVFRLPVHAVAGAALMGTFATSLFGVAFYSLMPAPPGIDVRPDWPLGLLFGAGGMVGMYLGARCQKFVPQRWLKVALALVLFGLAVSYVLYQSEPHHPQAGDDPAALAVPNRLTLVKGPEHSQSRALMFFISLSGSPSSSERDFGAVGIDGFSYRGDLAGARFPREETYPVLAAVATVTPDSCEPAATSGSAPTFPVLRAAAMQIPPARSTPTPRV